MPTMTRQEPKAKAISTITAADGLALADRLARAGTSRTPLDRSDMVLAAAIIRSRLGNAQPFDRFMLYAEDDEP